MKQKEANKNSVVAASELFQGRLVFRQCWWHRVVVVSKYIYVKNWQRQLVLISGQH